MRLLILTQKVDKSDPVLGFFHRWLEEFAKHCESIIVICLEKGEYDLPVNVKVLSLGKEERLKAGSYKLKAVFNFYKYIWRERKNYDKVFVHMNQIYVILGAFLWKVLSKKVGLWYTHGSVSVSLQGAVFLVDKIFTASKESFRIPSRKVFVTGHGIDTEFFSPAPNVIRGEHWLSVGRLMSSKRHDVAIREACAAGVPLRIAGEGIEHPRLESLASSLGAEVYFLGALSQSELLEEYRCAAKLIHRSETGSLDKVVLEAAACGCLVDSTDSAISVLPLSRLYVEERHSLSSLIPRILDSLKY